MTPAEVRLRKRKIGVLGGAGPEATALFYQRMIQYCQKHQGTKHDEDYPEILIYNLPIPQLVENIAEKETFEMLERGLLTLYNDGVDFVAIPCNTIQFFLDRMRQIIPIPIIGIIEETAKVISLKGDKCVGILATNSTINNKLYEKEFDKISVATITPIIDDQNALNRIILNILAGRKLKQDKMMLKNIIKKLKNKGAKTIILGCTELPLLIPLGKLNNSLIDTIDVLVKATIDYAISDSSPVSKTIN